MVFVNSKFKIKKVSDKNVKVINSKDKSEKVMKKVKSCPLGHHKCKSNVCYKQEFALTTYNRFHALVNLDQDDHDSYITPITEKSVKRKTVQTKHSDTKKSSNTVDSQTVAKNRHAAEKNQRLIFYVIQIYIGSCSFM